jgi:hypothetical protein
MTVVIFSAALVSGIGLGAALGLALFVGAFGGIGFGFMLGGMFAVTDHRNDRAPAPNDRAPAPNDEPAM